MQRTVRAGAGEGDGVVARRLEDLRRGVSAMRDVMAQPEIARYLTGELGPWKNARSRPSSRRMTPVSPLNSRVS